MQSKQRNIRSARKHSGEPVHTEKRSIDELLGSSVRVDVLWVLLQNPADYFGFRDLERLTGRSLSDVQRNIGILWRIGLVETRVFDTKTSPLLEPVDLGSRKAYRLNGRHPWIPALKMLLENSIGSIHLIREELSKLDGIEVAFVFGSFAESSQTPESDVDLAVIGKQTLRTLAGPISELERRIRREIDLLTYSPEDWRVAFEERSHFVVSLLDGPKVFLMGDEKELERLTLGQ